MRPGPRLCSRPAGRRPLAALAAVAVLGSLAAGGAPGASADPGGAHPSIVQLGDSVASGEGTLYGYTYSPLTQRWSGGNVNVTWPGPYPLCHDSPDAYGQVVAARLGATFSQFACTGSSFDNGISAPRVNKGYLYDTTLRPAQFGDWADHKDLNADYDAAKPDVVVVTMGADDVQFVEIVEACIENGYEYYFDLTATLDCTAQNPGTTVTTDFVDQLPTLEDHDRTLVSWIKARAQADGTPSPGVVFTDYYNPLPTPGRTCPDVSYLYPKQTAYLSGLLQTLDDHIVSTITALDDPDVSVVDIASALDGHRFCSTDPWAYGLSIYKLDEPTSAWSQAPFHPTPAGQQAIADLVEPAVEHELAQR